MSKGIYYKPLVSYWGRIVEFTWTVHAANYAKLNTVILDQSMP